MVQVPTRRSNTKGDRIPNPILSKVPQPKLRVLGSEGKRILPAKDIPGISLPTQKVSPLPKPIGTTSIPKRPDIKVEGVLVGTKTIRLREVKGEEIRVSYELYSTLPSVEPIDWASPLPDKPLQVLIVVGAAYVLVNLSPICLHRWYREGKGRQEVRASFRAASDVRGYNDTYVLADWSASDVCFYLRTHILNYVVDNNPMSEYLNVWKCIVWKHEALSKERFLKISGGEFWLEEEDIQKLSFIKGVEVSYGV